MSASNSRNALWPAWSVCLLCPKQSPAEYAPCCAGAANKSTEPRNHKLYLSQILVWFCGKNSFWDCLLKCQLWFPLLEIFHGEVHQKWLKGVWHLLDNLWQTGSCPKLGTRITEAKSWWLVSLTLMIGYVWICVSLLMYSSTHAEPLHALWCSTVDYVPITENSKGNFGRCGWDSPHLFCSTSLECQVQGL